MAYNFTKEKTLFGIHEILFLDRNTGMPLAAPIKGGQASASLNLSAEALTLMGGSMQYPLKSNQGAISSEFTCTVRELPPELVPYLLGASVATTAASATGTVSALTNKTGTSLFSATTGVASVAALAGSETSLKIGKYVLKAASATTIDIYALSDADFHNGTDVAYVDNTSAKVTASPITITGTGGTTDYAALGLQFTGGSGTVAFTTDDTAVFEVVAAHGGIHDITIGAVGLRPSEVAIYVVGQLEDDRRACELEIYRAKCKSGLPVPFNEKAFAEMELAFDVLFDGDKNGVAKLRLVDPA